MDMRDGAFLAGIEKLMMELSVLLMGPTLELMKSLMQTTTAVYCLGKIFVSLLPFSFFVLIVLLRYFYFIYILLL